MKKIKDSHYTNKNYTKSSTENKSLFLQIEQTSKKLQGIIKKTPLEYSNELSNYFGAEIYLKREDLQITNSYKIRGAYNAIASLFENSNTPLKEIVCASAGNHSQGVAYVCQLLGIKGCIYMPINTPSIKVSKTKKIGGDAITINLTGDCFDDAEQLAKTYAQVNNIPYIHPFNNIHVIEGQGTVGYEIIQDFKDIGEIDAVIVPVGGGGLISGIIQSFKNEGIDTEIIGVQPNGAPSMKLSLESKK